jgi:hypothetical protein
MSPLLCLTQHVQMSQQSRNTSSSCSSCRSSCLLLMCVMTHLGLLLLVVLQKLISSSRER